MGGTADDMEVGRLGCIGHKVVGRHLYFHVGIIDKDRGVGPLHALIVGGFGFVAQEGKVVGGQGAEGRVFHRPFEPELTVFLHCGFGDFASIGVFCIQQSYFHTCCKPGDGAMNAEGLPFSLLLA